MTDIAKLVPNITLDLDLQKDDVIAVVVANHETELREEKGEIDDRISNLSKTLDSSRKELDKVIKSFSDSHWYFKKDKLKMALEDMGTSSVSFSSEISKSESESSEGVQVYRFNLYVQIGRAMGSTRLQFMHEERFYGEDHDVNVLTKAIEETRLKLDDLRAKSVALSGKLRDMPSIERRARAALGRYTMQKTAEGRELMIELDQVKSKALSTNKKD